MAGIPDGDEGLARCRPIFCHVSPCTVVSRASDEGDSAIVERPVVVQRRGNLAVLALETSLLIEDGADAEVVEFWDASGYSYRRRLLPTGDFKSIPVTSACTGRGVGPRDRAKVWCVDAAGNILHRMYPKKRRKPGQVKQRKRKHDEVGGGGAEAELERSRCVKQGVVGRVVGMTNNVIHMKDASQKRYRYSTSKQHGKN